MNYFKGIDPYNENLSIDYHKVLNCYLKENIMKIYDSLKKAFEDKDFDGLMKFYHSDYSFIRHQTNTTMSLSRVVSHDEKYAREQQV